MVRVQVVEDNEALRAVACVEVEMAHDMVLVGEAADGAEAIVVAARQRPDVILLDLEMPVMNGFDALPGLLAAVPDVLVVVYTSHDSAYARSEALRLGARAYAVKGQTPVRDVLEAARAEAQGPNLAC